MLKWEKAGACCLDGALGFLIGIVFAVQYGMSKGAHHLSSCAHLISVQTLSFQKGVFLGAHITFSFALSSS